MYDYTIVGAGLFGAVFAYEAMKRGKKCRIVEKRSHIAGNLYCEEIEGIQVHRYGAHIFHTSNEDIWRFVNQFASFNHYINAPIAIYKEELYNLPFNMNTFSKMWGIRTPEQAKEKIRKEVSALAIAEPTNLEEQALSLVGPNIYEKLVKGYTEKQWGRNCRELPAFIIKRLPLRFTYDNNYFNDRFQGIPVGGYTRLIEKMLEGADIVLNTDYLECREAFTEGTLVFTGMIDAYFSYCFGALDYRTLRFEDECFAVENYQGNAVVNYTDAAVPYTRIIEHKHFEFGTQPNTVITREYPCEWINGSEPYYPINDEKNTKQFLRYAELAKEEKDDSGRKVIFGGRLGEYRYYDMDKVIQAAQDVIRKEFSL